MYAVINKFLREDWHLTLASGLIQFDPPTARAPWLKSKGYSVREVNLFPTLTVAVGVVTALVSAGVSDAACGGVRWPVIVVAAVISVITYHAPGGVGWRRAGLEVGVLRWHGAGRWDWAGGGGWPVSDAPR